MPSPVNEKDINSFLVLVCLHHPYCCAAIAILLNAKRTYSVADRRPRGPPTPYCRPFALDFFRCANVASHKPNGTTCPQAKYSYGPSRAKAPVWKGLYLVFSTHNSYARVPGSCSRFRSYCTPTTDGLTEENGKSTNLIFRQVRCGWRTRMTDHVYPLPYYCFTGAQAVQGERSLYMKNVRSPRSMKTSKKLPGGELRLRVQF
jgi:hypothetical protein